MPTTPAIAMLTAASLVSIVSPQTSTALQRARVCTTCVGSGLPPKNLMTDMTGARRTEPIPPPGKETCKWVPASNKTDLVCRFVGDTVLLPNEFGPAQLNIDPSDKTRLDIGLQFKTENQPWIGAGSLTFVLLYGGDVKELVVPKGNSGWDTNGVVVQVDPASRTVRITEDQLPGIFRGDWRDACPHNNYMPNLDQLEVKQNITTSGFDLDKKLEFSLEHDAKGKTLSLRINNATADLQNFNSLKMAQVFGWLGAWKFDMLVNQADYDSENSGDETNVDTPSQSCEMRSPVSLFSGCLVRPNDKSDQSGDVVVYYNKNGWRNVSGDLSDTSNFPGETALFSKFPENRDNKDFNFETRIVFDPIISDVFGSSLRLGCGMDLVLTPNAWRLTTGSPPTTEPLLIASFDSSTGTAAIIFQEELRVLTYSQHCPMDQRPMIIQEKKENSALCSISVQRGDVLTVSHRRIGDIYQVGLATNVGPACSVRFIGMRWANSFSMKLMPHPNSKALEAPSLCYEHFELVNITRGPGCEKELSNPNHTVDLTTPDDSIDPTGPDDPIDPTDENHEDDKSNNLDVINFLKENLVIIGPCVGVLFILALFFYLFKRYVSQAERGQEMQVLGPRDRNEGGQPAQPERNNDPADQTGRTVIAPSGGPSMVRLTQSDDSTGQPAQLGGGNGPLEQEAAGASSGSQGQMRDPLSQRVELRSSLGFDDKAGEAGSFYHSKEASERPGAGSATESRNSARIQASSVGSDDFIDVPLQGAGAAGSSSRGDGGQQPQWGGMEQGQPLTLPDLQE